MSNSTSIPHAVSSLFNVGRFSVDNRQLLREHRYSFDHRNFPNNIYEDTWNSLNDRITTLKISKCYAFFVQNIGSTI